MSKHDVRARIWVFGQVQGVFFRANTARHARSLGLKGWVKNLDDGRVEATVEGEQARVNALIEWCHDGPAAAEVDDVRVRWDTAKGKFKAFEIER